MLPLPLLPPSGLPPRLPLPLLPPSGFPPRLSLSPLVVPMVVVLVLRSLGAKPLLLLTVEPLSGRPLSEVTVPLLPVLLLLPLLPPRDTAPLPVREPLLERLVVVVVVVGRFTWLLLLGVATVLRLVVELLRFTWLLLLGAATVPRLLEALLRLT